MLSVIVPSIRPGNLPRLYESIQTAYSGEFEFIVVGPQALDGYFAGRRLAAIGPTEITKYVLARQERHVSNATVNRELASRPQAHASASLQARQALPAARD